MNFNRIHLRWLLPLLLVVLLAGGVGLFAWWRAAAAPQADHSPALAAQDSLGAQIAEAEYIYTWHAPLAAWLAANPTQGWRTAFGAGGLRLEPSGGQGWHFALRLSAWGRAGALQAVEGVPPAAEKERVTYTRTATLVEWYTNDSRGIEQGFDLAAAPSAGSGELVLEMAVDSDLAASHSPDGLAVTFSRAGEAVLRYADLLVQDATGASLPARLELANDTTLRLIVDDSNAQYPITVDPLIASLQASPLAPDGAAFDRLGASVALDGNTLVIGAAQADVGANLDQGAVYVFIYRGDIAAWVLARKITVPDGAAYDEFGAALALQGDTLIVGAPCTDTCRGAVYVFARNQGGTQNWGQLARLTASDGAAYDRFGASVALDGATAVIGAPLQADARGAAYIFSYTTIWNQTNKLLAVDGLAGDRLGIAVALSGDLALVGADGADVNGEAYEQGAAYLFARDQGGSGQWGQFRKLLASDGAGNDGFGRAVALSGDDAVCAAPDAAVSGRKGQGAAWLFSRNQGGAESNWSQMRKFSAADGEAADGFGSALAFSGDTLAIGAPLADVGDNKDQGAAYVYTRDEGGAGAWGLSVKVTANDGAAGDQFARALSLSRNTLSAGIFLADIEGQRDQGGAQVYALSQPPTNTPTPTHTSTPTRTPTRTPTPTVNPDVIFADGFESGDFSAWSSYGSSPCLQVAKSELIGQYGMHLTLQGKVSTELCSGSLYVQDDAPVAATRYRVRFYFDPNSISMSSGETQVIFEGYKNSSTAVVRIELSRDSFYPISSFRIRASARYGRFASWTYTSWYNINDASNYIEFDWVSATAGSLTLWLNGSQVQSLTNIDTSSYTMEYVRLGKIAVSGSSVTTDRLYYLDAFESRRTTYIGPAAGK